MRAKTDTQYEHDFYAWTLNNAQLLRKGKIAEVDLQNVAEEIESIGKSEKRELINCLAILTAHLLKWKLQQGKRSNSWKYTIEKQRDEILDLFKESPSLKKELTPQLARAYKRGVLIAATETNLGKEIFPRTCPFSLEELLNTKFFPMA